MTRFQLDMTQCLCFGTPRAVSELYNMQDVDILWEDAHMHLNMRCAPLTCAHSQRRPLIIHLLPECPPRNSLKYLWNHTLP